MKKFIFLISILFTVLFYAQDDAIDSQYQKAYVVVADTSQNYFDLRKKMFFLNEKTDIKIDTLDRGFDSKKNRICLSENHEDEIYAGDYFPRRTFDENLSLEYYTMYSDKNTIENRMVLITILTKEKTKAENNLKRIKQYFSNAFMLETEIFMGCLH